MLPKILEIRFVIHKWPLRHPVTNPIISAA
jgi:hypothetical protein